MFQTRVLVYRIGDQDLDRDLEYLKALEKEAPEHLRKAIRDLIKQICVGKALGVLGPGDEVCAVI